jgi:hypothetical protein
LDVVFPSVYQFYDSAGKPGTAKSNAAYVRSNVGEAVRIAAAVPTKCPAVVLSNAGAGGARSAANAVARVPPPVWAYTWHRYHSAANGFLSTGDLTIGWEESAAAGAAGIVMWGSEPTTRVSFVKWYDSVFVPLAKAWPGPATL